ncbi:hypothetical protein yfred0001_13370 [Yersinia frederiksenii ATCC 33641]|nr:hypothetical protein yfred0001_13370 [Yersinia frederiksenii ATCC 33641]
MAFKPRASHLISFLSHHPMPMPSTTALTGGQFSMHKTWGIKD